jgi:hypothetical protein
MLNPTRFLTLFLIFASALLLPAASEVPPRLASPEMQADLSAAFFRRLQRDSGPAHLVFDLFTPELDMAFISPDEERAVLWLALRDDSGRRLATEPGLALAHHSDDGWQALLPEDPGWAETLATLPDGMLPLELKPAPQDLVLGIEATTAPLTGYYLPYAAGTSRWLEGSISHFQSIPELGYPSCSIEYCRYAYDFTDSWHFPLVASKRGTVIGWRDSCIDGDPYCTNYIVLRNTSEGTYQIYLHLAHNTIPNKLTPGTTVQRGEYIGDTDDTGYSTSQHVHFMVTDSIWMGSSGYYWGRSIDIRFADVPINNGIPRTCYEVTHFPIYDGATECLGDRSTPRNPSNDWFVSGNPGAFPPTGTLTRPVTGTIVTSGDISIIDVSALASDDVNVSAVQLVAKVADQWVEIGPKVTKPAQPGLYDWDVDLCSAGAFNGPLEVALRIWDHEGNVASALTPRTIQVEHACPPPSSRLNPAEVFDSTAVHLGWDAIQTGAGIDSFELQWRPEPGIWQAANILSLPGDLHSTWFAGSPGGVYAFRLRALDLNSQAELWPEEDAFEALVTLPIDCQPDEFEPDDVITQTRMLRLDGWEQGNLCGAGDPDWYQVVISDTLDYYVSAPSISGGAAVSLTVYANDGETILASGQAHGLGQSAIVQFPATAVGSYYIKAEPLTPNLIGTEAVYAIQVSEVKQTYLPMVTR